MEKKPFWKRLLIAILNIPYFLLFDRITPSAVKWAIYTKSYKMGDDFCKSKKWKDYFFESAGKKVVVLGIANAFWTIAKQEAGMILCGIDWTGKYAMKKPLGIQVFPPDYLKNLSKRDDCVFLITTCTYVGIQTACDYLKEYGIQNYYSYAYMECQRLKYLISKPAYKFLRFRDYMLHKDGFVQSNIIFTCKSLLRRIWPSYARKSYKAIKSMKNRHKGQRCFIVATGPSLEIADVELLKNEVTFGVNSIYRLYDQTEWRPTYYVMVDYKVFLDQKGKGHVFKFNSYSEKESFVVDRIFSMLSEVERDERPVSLLINYLDHMVFGEGFHFKYRKNIARGIYNAATVVNSCINIAHYMGFSEIYLLGVDCNYKLPKQYFNEDKNWLARDVEHATMVNYLMQSGFSYYKNKMDHYGVKVFNTTRGGMLEVFPRICLEDALKNPKHS